MRAHTEILRIRSYGGRWTVTHKRIPDSGVGEDRHKHRVETETEVADGAVLADIFTALGLVAAFRYEKWRSEWSDGEGHCVVDETPIGNFAELEGAPEWIDSAAARLGISPSEYMTLSYGRLFEQWQVEHQSKAQDLTFEAIAANDLSKAQGGWDARTGNNVRYDSPNYNGFTFAAQYSTQSATGGFNDASATVTNQPPNGLTPAFSGSNGSQAQGVRHASVWGINGIYTNGPLQLAASGEFNVKVRQYENTVALGQGCTASSPCIYNANDYDYTVTGAYDFGTIMKSFGLRVGVVYEHTNYQVQNLDASTSTLNRNFWGLSGTIPIGGGTAYLFWGKAGNGHGSAPAGTTVGYVVSGNDTSTQQWELSYSYSLSPRTLLYTGFVKIANKAYNPTTFDVNPYTIQTCEYGSSCNAGQPTGVVFGMVHFF